VSRSLVAAAVPVIGVALSWPAASPGTAQREARKGMFWAIEGCNGIGKQIAHRLIHDSETVVDGPLKLSARQNGDRRVGRGTYGSIDVNVDGCWCGMAA
jgi:hypothetical protein